MAAPGFSPLKIGISCAFKNSFFSTSHGQNVFALASGFQKIGHSVFLIRISEQEWFDDLQPLKSVFPIVSYVDFINKGEKVDIFVDVDGTILPDRKVPYANKVVTFLPQNGFINEMQQILFSSTTSLRDMTGVDALLVWDIYHEQNKTMYEVMYKRPVIALPYNWFHTAINTYVAMHAIPKWMARAEGEGSGWTCHIVESNIKVGSSCVLPMTIVKQIHVKGILSLDKCVINNSNHLENNAYFKQNVLQHCTIADISYNMVGRQRIVDIRIVPRSFIVSHIRFSVLKPALLDAIWAGIPVIHNSPWLRDVGYGLERFYYEDNDIEGACKATEAMKADYEARTGFFDEATYGEMQKAILKKLYYDERIIHKWGEALGVILNTKKQEVVAAAAGTGAIKVGFADMWHDFNPAYNFFTLLLEKESKRPIVGSTAAADCDIIIFGPFGTSWKNPAWSHIPKIHYSGENTEPVDNPSVALNLTFRADDPAKKNIRLPLWMLEIDWFDVDAERIRNPKPIKLEKPDIERPRPKFCNFIVSNPKNELRNNSFHWLNSYKPVDSAGRLYNTIGDVLAAGPGGGGGELKKFEFLKDYKFSLTFENESARGYVTEKLFHAKAAGSIPIYWGAPDVAEDFDPRGFINANGVTGRDELVALVEAVDDERWKAMAAVPVLDEERLGKTRRRLARIAEAILVAAKYKTGPHYFTYASAAVAKNLHLWCKSIGRRTATVFLAPDFTAGEFKAAYPDITFIGLSADAVQIADFADFWTPTHYAWKPYIIDRIVRDAQYAGVTCIYLDCGATVLKDPEDYLKAATTTGIAFLEDPTQTNRRWCHETFCQTLAVTEAELDAHQIWAGCIAFVGGNTLACSVAAEAWAHAQKRAVIVGEKWLRQPAANGSFGHRHDQSIYSIVGLRLSVPLYPLYSVYNDKSAGDARATGAAFYVHRGDYKEKVGVFPGITEARIVNLKRRPDRLQKFREAHTAWADRVAVEDAVDGLKIELNSKLAALFKGNDFFWKRCVMGCALSHLNIWKDMAESNTIESMLVLEDDVLFHQPNPFGSAEWSEAIASAPADWDVIYLGGVLPPNKVMFENLLQPVGKHWSIIKDHTYFGQRTPGRYFHFCTYAYIIRREAVLKLMGSIKARGYYHTSVDHLLGNQIQLLKHYIYTPNGQKGTVAGCYQDADPKYANSSFNDFSRVDEFDSEIWNNDQRFEKSTIENLLGAGVSVEDALGYRREEIYGIAQEQVKLHILEGHDLKLMEQSWLEYLMERSIEIVKIRADTEPLDSTPIFVVQRPYTESYALYFRKYENAGKKYKVIHLSDEHTGRPEHIDPIGWYMGEHCIAILRNYKRADAELKAAVIPLGWADGSSWSATAIADRKYIWSFYGTKWFDRENAMSPLKTIEPNTYKFYDSWSAPKLGREEYAQILRESVYAPCPGGNNVETFRFYEALECGSVPIFVRTEGDEEWYKYITKYIPLINLLSWTAAAQLMDYFYKNKSLLEKYRESLMAGWQKLKAESKGVVKQFLEKA